MIGQAGAPWSPPRVTERRRPAAFSTASKVFSVGLPFALRLLSRLSWGRPARFGFSTATLRHWERGDRAPHGPALVLLNVIDHNPKAVIEALSA